MNLRLFTDGGCRPNPGPGAWAFAVVKPPEISEPWFWEAGSVPATTNNRMELEAVIHGVGFLHRVGVTIQANTLEILCDSRYVTMAFTEGWHTRWEAKNFAGVKNVEEWKKLLAVLALWEDRVRFTWVRGHNGNAMNDFVDELATAAMAEARELGGAQA